MDEQEAPRATAATEGAPVQVSVDQMPAPEVLAGLTPEERSAIYLNSIRKMLVFFTVLAVVGLIGGAIVAIVGFHDVQQVQTCTGIGC